MAVQSLKEKVLNFDIGSPDDALSFQDRLCRENNWSPAYAGRCILEYKKFIYLIAVLKEPMTPSDQVDQVWHLHLTYTRSYWVDLCEGVLGFKLHHEPTRGGQDEFSKFQRQYQKTLSHYQAVFSHDPPADIWPEPTTRFVKKAFVRLNTSAYWLVKKPVRLLYGSLAALPFFLVACSDLSGEHDFWYYFERGFGVVMALIILKWLFDMGGGGGGGGRKGGEGGGGYCGSCGGSCGSSCGGGCGGCGG